MDYKKELDGLQTCLKNFNKNLALKFLSNKHFILNKLENVLQMLGNGLTESNFNSKPEYFNFCEEQLLKIAQILAHQEKFFDVLDLIFMEDCKLSSCVLVVVTVLENTTSPDLICLEYLLISTFNSLNQTDDVRLKEDLPIVLQHLTKLSKSFQHERSLWYYFARVTFLVLRAKMNPTEYLKILSNIINDPFYLLEFEFKEMEENLYLASFYYLYFKTEIPWGPKIYNQFYILKKCSHLAMSVFEDNNFGKSFTKLILKKFKDNEIPLYFLNKSHENFFMEAAHSLLYNDDLNIRKDSLELLLMYMDKLCSDAQYIVFKRIFLKPIDSCIKEQLIIKMKNLLLSKLKSKQDLGFFQGKRLLELVEVCCNITDGPKCYVVQNKEHILAVISLLYLLYVYNGTVLIMDKSFKNYVKQFIDNIQNAIDHTNEQLKIDSQSLVSKNTEDDKEEQILLNLPKLSESEKQKALLQCSTSVKLVESNLNLLKTIIND